MARPNMAAAKRPPNKRQLWTHGFTQCIDVGTRCWMIIDNAQATLLPLPSPGRLHRAHRISPPTHPHRASRPHTAQATSCPTQCTEQHCTIIGSPMHQFYPIALPSFAPTIAMPPPSTEPHNHPQTNTPMHIQCPLQPNLPHVTHTPPCVHSLLCAVCNKPHMCQGTSDWTSLQIPADCHPSESMRGMMIESDKVGGAGGAGARAAGRAQRV